MGVPPEPAPLDGILVLDLTQELGAYATRLLAGLGADVLRIEPPGGDPLRRRSPFIQGDAGPESSLAYRYANGGKRTLVADLDTDAGRALVIETAARAHLLVESQPTHALDRCGLGYASLSQRYPALVYVSVSPFGRSGPWSGYAADDLVLAALGGILGLTGAPDRPPLLMFGQPVYQLTGTHAAFNAVAALRAARLSGRGQYIDVSAEACVAASLDRALVRYLADGVVLKRQGTRYWNDAFDVFRATDGYVALSLHHQWDELVAWLEADGMAEGLSDPRYRSQAAREADLPRLLAVLGGWAATKRTDELFAEGQLRRFPFAPVRGIDALLTNPQLRSRGFFRPAADPRGGTMEVPGPPLRLRGMENVPW